MKLNREMFRPVADSGFVSFEGELPSGVELYIDADNNSLIAFKGRKVKPVIYGRYPSFERMIYARDRFINDVNEDSERRRLKKSWVHDVKVGDVFRASWGYEQTNVDYYEVVKLVGKTMVEVLEIDRDIKHTDDMQGACIPMPGYYSNNDIMRLKVKGATSPEPYLKVSCCANAHRIKPVEIVPGVEVFSADNWSSYH